jgi:hypothetical protein
MNNGTIKGNRVLGPGISIPNPTPVAARAFYQMVIIGMGSINKRGIRDEKG